MIRNVTEYVLTLWSRFILKEKKNPDFHVMQPRCVFSDKPLKDEAQTALFKDPVRTAL